MTELSNTLPAQQRLKSKQQIDNLFASGKSGIAYPLRYVVLSEGGAQQGEVLVMVSVSKKRHKRANVRNLIKRRMREAYRLNKQPFRDGIIVKNESVSLALMYISSDVLDYRSIENAVCKIIGELSKGS